MLPVIFQYHRQWSVTQIGYRSYLFLVDIIKVKDFLNQGKKLEGKRLSYKKYIDSTTLKALFSNDKKI